MVFSPRDRFRLVILMTFISLAATACTPSVAGPRSPVPRPSSASEASSVPERAFRFTYSRDANARRDIQTALLQAREDQKLVLLNFGANWCPPCWALSSTFKQPSVRPFLEEHFRVVPIDIGNFDHNTDVTGKYANATEQGIPAVVVLDANGEIIAVTKGDAFARISRSATEMLSYLNTCVRSREASGTPLVPAVALEPAGLVSYAETLMVRAHGGPMGITVVGLEASPDSLVSIVLQTIEDQLVQHVVATLDPGTGRPKVVRESTASTQLDLTFTPGRVRGLRVTRDRSGAVDSVLLNLADSSVFDRRTLLAIIPALPLKEGWSLTAHVFDSRLLGSVPVRIAVADRSRIMGRAGIVDAFRVELTGDSWALPTTLYITALHPRRLYRMERPRHRFTLERAR